MSLRTMQVHSEILIQKQKQFDPKCSPVTIGCLQYHLYKKLLSKAKKKKSSILINYLKCHVNKG